MRVLSPVAPTCRFADRATPPRGSYPAWRAGLRRAGGLSSRSAAAPGVWPRGAAVLSYRLVPLELLRTGPDARTSLDCLGLLVPLSGIRRSPPPMAKCLATGRAARGLGVGSFVAAADRGEPSVAPFGDTARRGSRLTDPPVFPMGRCSRMRFSRRPFGVSSRPRGQLSVAARVGRRLLK